MAETLFLPVGEWWLLVLGEVGAFFFDIGN